MALKYAASMSKVKLNGVGGEDGAIVGLTLGTVGVSVGLTVGVVGCRLGDIVGSSVGKEGASVGETVGAVGATVGLREGVVGVWEGLAVGDCVGMGKISKPSQEPMPSHFLVKKVLGAKYVMPSVHDEVPLHDKKHCSVHVKVTL